MKITSDNTNQLTQDAQITLIEKIAQGVRDFHRAGNTECFSVELLLDAMLDFLDDVDEEDGFGTEGWRHALGLDD